MKEARRQGEGTLAYWDPGSFAMLARTADRPLSSSQKNFKSRVCSVTEVMTSVLSPTMMGVVTQSLILLEQVSHQVRRTIPENEPRRSSPVGD